MKSPIEGHSEVVNCFRKRVEKFQDLKADGSSTLNGLEKTINVNESAMVKKNGSAAVQALVRVAVKNGVPLFTFAVDNDIAILAATMKKLNTSKNDDCSCIYTFFSIREVKKKTATWMHPEVKSPDYVGQVRHANKTKGGGKHKRISDCSDNEQVGDGNMLTSVLDHSIVSSICIEFRQLHSFLY
ncbi:hypothetical protein EV1_029080 [Malus domestica]